MLVDSPRLTPQDRDAWTALERYDARLAAALPPLEDHALEVIRGFHEAGPCHATTSWGKDSTVLVDLIGRTGLDIPIVSLVIDGYELPGTTQVRDIMLDRHPHLVYDELTLPPQPNRWWAQTTVKRSKHDADIGWRLIERRYGPRRMTGIRAEESRLRTLVQQRWGDASANACRPIGRWRATDVFAYLHRHGLPAHPAYGMSHGGRLDRRWLRVHALGGVTGADRGRADWEEAYFGDVIATSIHRDAVMAALPDGPGAAVLASTVAAETRLTVPQTTAALDRLVAQGRVGARRLRYATRYYRTVGWPPPPTWLRPEPPPSRLF